MCFLSAVLIETSQSGSSRTNKETCVPSNQVSDCRRLTAACHMKVRYNPAAQAAARAAPPWFTPVWCLAARHINRRRNGKTGLLTSGRAGTYKSSASGLILTALSAGARDSLAGRRAREAGWAQRVATMLLGCQAGAKIMGRRKFKGQDSNLKIVFFFLFFFNNPFRSEPQLRGKGDRSPFVHCTRAGLPSFWTLLPESSYSLLLRGIHFALGFHLWYYDKAATLALVSPWNCRRKTKMIDRE